MMEAFAVGPASFGPLVQGSIDGHGNSVARGITGLQNIFAKTGSISEVAKEAARNDLTYTQEFKWGDIFMSFNYQNKNGKWFSGGRTLEELNDPSEIGGDRVERVIAAQERMMSDPTISEAIVVSEDLGYGRHFIYRYRRGENSDIEGLAFEYQGTTGELNEVVDKLSSRAINQKDNKKGTFDFSKPLFFIKGKENSIDNLSKIALSSFHTDKRKNEMGSYLSRLERDTKDFEKLSLRRQKQEQELQRQFEELMLKDENTKAGIASAVYGMIRISEKMAASEDRRREEPVRLDGVTPGLIGRLGKAMDKKADIIINNSKSNDFVKTPEAKNIFIPPKEQITQQVIKPITPAIIGLLQLIGSLPEEKPVFSDANGGIFAGESNKLFAGTTEQVWQEFIAVLFCPIADDEVNMINITADRNKGKPVLIAEDFIVWEESLSELLLLPTRPAHTYEADEIYSSPQTEGLALLKYNFQKGLEIAAEAVTTDGVGRADDKMPKQEVENQISVESEVIKLGEEIIGMIFAGANMPKLQPSFIRLSFLLNVYKDKNSKDIVKHLLAVLIYKQIEKIYMDKEMLVMYPQFAIISAEFTKLYPKTDFLKRKFNLLLQYLNRINAVNDSGKYEFDNTNQDLTGFVIYLILKNLQIQSSIEVLPLRNTIVGNNHRKKKKMFSQRGIIYCFSNEVIYQYPSLLVTYPSV